MAEYISDLQAKSLKHGGKVETDTKAILISPEP